MLSFSENLNWSELSCQAKFFCRQWFFPHFVCLLKLFNKITFGMLVTKFSRAIKTIKEKVLSLIDTAAQLGNFIPKESDKCPADVLLRDLLWIGKLLSHMKCFYTETSRWSGKLLLLKSLSLQWRIVQDVQNTLTSHKVFKRIQLLIRSALFTLVTVPSLNENSRKLHEGGLNKVSSV